MNNEKKTYEIIEITVSYDVEDVVTASDGGGYGPEMPFNVY